MNFGIVGFPYYYGMVQIPVNPQVLKWAIEEARTDVWSLSERCGIPSTKIESWLEGTDQPNKGQLQAVAKRLERSIQFFLLPEPPPGLQIGARFRRSMHEDVPEPEKESAALRSARRAQQVVRWARDEQSLEPEILPAEDQESAGAYAARLRAHLHWTVALQKGATSKSAVFRLLRERVEEQGITVLYQSAGEKSFRGFSLPDSPHLIFINKDYHGAALRAFTLIHEMAHVGSATGGRSCYYDDTARERWCNQVATEFLLPKKEFRKYIDGKNVSFVSSRDTEIVRLASQHFRSSWLAVSIRLKELGYANQELVDFIRDNWDLERDPSTPVTGVDRSTPVIRREEFGATFIRSVRKAVLADEMSDMEAGRLLRANSSQLRSIWSSTSQAG